MAVSTAPAYAAIGYGRISLYDLKGAHKLWTASRDTIYPHGAFAFDATGKSIITIAYLDTPERHNMTMAEERQQWRDVVFSLLSVEADGALQMVRDATIEDTSYKLPFNNKNPRVSAIAVSPDGNTVAANMGVSGTVALYDTKTLTLKQHLGPWFYHSNDRDLAFNFKELFLDTTRGLLIGFDPLATVSVWDIKANKEISRTKPHVADGKWVVTAGDATAYAFNPVTGAYVTSAGYYGPVEKAISERMTGVPDNEMTRALSKREFNEDKLINAWDPRTGEKTITYPTTPGYGGINALAVSPDGRYLAAIQGSGLLEVRIMLWDAVTTQFLGTIHYDGKGHWSYAIAFSPDSTKLAYAVDSTVHIVELDPSLSRQPGGSP
jgi:WD40 repeat protein